MVVNSSYFNLLPDATSERPGLCQHRRLMIVFLATNLSEDGSHSLTVQNLGSPAGQNNVIDLDRLIVNSTRLPDSPNNGTNTTTSVSDSNEDAASDGTSTGVIAGSVVGGVVGIALILFAVWFFGFRRKRHGRRSSEAIDLAGDISSYDHGRYDRGQVVPLVVDQDPAGPPAPGRQMSQATSSESAGTATNREHFITAFPPPPTTSTTSDQYAAYSGITPYNYSDQTYSSHNASDSAEHTTIPTEERLMSERSPTAGRPGSLGLTAPSNPSQSSTGPARPPVLKGQGPSTPVSARPAEVGLRETDAGLFSMSPEDHGDIHEMLPPAYE